MLTTADKAAADARIDMAAALQELIGENDYHKSEQGRPKTNDEQAGSALLEVIRLLTKMPPDERTALILLLKTLG